MPRRIWWKKHACTKIARSPSAARWHAEARVAIAQAANDLLTIQGVDASFVAVQVGTGVNVSARSLGAVNVQVIMESLWAAAATRPWQQHSSSISRRKQPAARIEGAIDKYYASQKKGDVEGK